MNHEERAEAVIQFISTHQHCTAQSVVDELQNKISRATIFDIIKELTINGAIRDNKDHENSRDHKLSVETNNPLISVPRELATLQKYFFSLFDKTKIFLDSNSKYSEIACAKIDGMFIRLLTELLRVYTHRAFISWPIQINDHKTLGKLHAEFSSRIVEIQRGVNDTLKHIPREEEPEKDVSRVTSYYPLDDNYCLRDLLLDFEDFYAVKNESRRLLHYLLEIRAQEVGSDNIPEYYDMLCKKNDDPQAYRRSMKSARKSVLKL